MCEVLFHILGKQAKRALYAASTPCTLVDYMTAQLRMIAKCLANAITHHRITPINVLLNVVTLYLPCFVDSVLVTYSADCCCCSR